MSDQPLPPNENPSPTPPTGESRRPSPVIVHLGPFGPASVNMSMPNPGPGQAQIPHRQGPMAFTFPTPGSDPSTPTPAPAAVPDQGLLAPFPIMSWQSPQIPSFFIRTPDGSLMPRFTPIPNPISGMDQPNNTTSMFPLGAPLGQIPSVGIRPANNPFTNTNTPFIQFQPPFTFIVQMAHREPQPDPAKAAELLRSLPNVSRVLLDRIDRIAVAEGDQMEEEGEEKGWKCGICLEGVQGDAGETGVKALPCNHLFHEDCLQPWFTTKNTCPTCRLDLDPLRTLDTPSTHQPDTLRPQPTASGSGRAHIHPYIRPVQAGGDNSASAGTIVWRMPTQPLQESSEGPILGEPLQVSTSQQPLSPASPHPEASIRIRSRSPTPTPQLRSAPSTPPPRHANLDAPTIIFNVPLHASPSPLPMARSTSTPDTPPPTFPPAEGGAGRSQPERRHHIHVIHQHPRQHPYMVQPSQSSQPSQAQQREQGGQNSVADSSAHPITSSHPERPAPHHHHPIFNPIATPNSSSIHLHPGVSGQSGISSQPGSSAQSTQPGQTHITPHHHHLQVHHISGSHHHHHHHPVLPVQQTPQPPAIALVPSETEIESGETQPREKPVKSLEEWVQDRERSLGFGNGALKAGAGNGPEIEMELGQIPEQEKEQGEEEDGVEVRIEVDTVDTKGKGVMLRLEEMEGGMGREKEEESEAEVEEICF